MKRYLLLLLVCVSAQIAAQPPQIVAFLGQKRVGKDTAADQLVQEYGYQKYALADPIKEGVQVLFCLSDDQLWGESKDVVDPYWQVTPRQILQFVGIDTLHDRLRNLLPDQGSSFAMRRFRRWLQERPDQKVVISDLRMADELCELKRMGARVILLERPSAAVADLHKSEAGIAEITGFDLTIVNDGTLDEFHQKVRKAMEG